MVLSYRLAVVFHHLLGLLRQSSADCESIQSLDYALLYYIIYIVSC
jgi:hypothetical protein